MSVPGPGASAPVAGDLLVGDTWAEAVRTAHLLTADQGRAEELAAVAFLRQRRRRLPASPADVGQLVLTSASSLSARLVTRSRRAAVTDDPFVAAYQRLSARRRALLVLRVADGLDGPAAAVVLGLRPQVARASVAAALDALRAALLSAGRWPGGDGATAGVELDLGELTPPRSGGAADGDPLPGDPVVPRLAAMFTELSAASPVVADPTRRVALVSGLARRRRQRLAAVAAGLVTVVASGALLEQRHAQDLAEQQRAQRLRAAEAALNPVVQGADIATWPTRGNLAGRADLMAEVRAAATPGEVDGAVLAAPYLGEVGGLVIALLVVTGVDNEENRPRQLVALAGPETQAVSAWQRAVLPVDPGGPDMLPVPVLSAAFGGGGDEPVRAVVVTVSSGASVAVSPRPQIDADGVAARRYTAVPLRNGVGTTTWQGPLPAALVRVQYRDSPPSIRPVALWQGPDGEATTTRTALPASCRGAPFAGLRSHLDGAVQRAAAQFGLLADEVAQVRVVGCRRVAGHAVMIIGVRAVDGTALQSALEEAVTVDGTLFASEQARTVPRGREVSFPRIVGLSAGDAPSDLARRTVLFTAPGGASAELVRRSPEGTVSVLAKARLAADGVGVVTAAAPFEALLEQSPALLFLAVRDTAGRLVESVPLPAADGIEPQTLDGPVDPPADGPP